MLNKGSVFIEPTGRSAPLAGDPAVSRGTSTPVLDPKALTQLQQLDPTGANGFVDRVLTTFQRSAGDLAATLADARRTGDRKRIRLVVHTLKSSSAHIGASTLGALSGGIEAAIVDNTRDDLSAELDALNLALESTLAAIRQQLGPVA